MAWDAVQMKWISFLNDYDFEFQKSFLEGLGLKHITRWVLFGIAAFGILIFVITFALVLRRRAHRIDPVIEAWRVLCQKLARAGVKKDLNEGPLDFTKRAASKFPNEAKTLHEIGTQYAVLRYGPANSGPNLREFRRTVSRFKTPHA